MTNSCPWCGREAQLDKPRWVLDVPREIESMNVHLVNGKHTAWKYKKHRQGWFADLTILARVHAIPPASGKRRVEILRCFSGRCREWDYDNFVGGCKPVIDAMRIAKIIRDDNSANLLCLYRQERALRGLTRISLWEN